jgi:hypothetical protein
VTDAQDQFEPSGDDDHGSEEHPQHGGLCGVVPDPERQFADHRRRAQAMLG